MRAIAHAIAVCVGVASAIPAITYGHPRTNKLTDVFVAVGAPTTVGFLDVEVTTNVVKGRAKALERCHTPSASTVGKDTAQLTLRIRADGVVTASRATGLAAKANACVVAAVAKLKVPKPQDGQPAEVTYPLTYSTPESARVAAIGSLGTLDELDFCADCGGGVGPPAGPGGWGKVAEVSGPIGNQSAGVGDYNGSGRVPPRTARTQYAKVTLGQPTVTGADAAMIRRHIKRSVGSLRYCYEKQLPVDAKLKGTLTVAFTYGGDGRVSTTSVSGMKNVELESCIAGVFKAMTFAEPGGSKASVSYPISFAP